MPTGNLPEGVRLSATGRVLMSRDFYAMKPYLPFGFVSIWSICAPFLPGNEANFRAGADKTDVYALGDSRWRQWNGVTGSVQLSIWRQLPPGVAAVLQYGTMTGAPLGGSRYPSFEMIESMNLHEDTTRDQLMYRIDSWWDLVYHKAGLS